jgi:hypothetical protein
MERARYDTVVFLLLATVGEMGRSQLASFDETEGDNSEVSPGFKFGDFEIMRLARKTSSGKNDNNFRLYQTEEKRSVASIRVRR